MKGNSTNEKIWNKDLADHYGPIVGLFLGNKPFIMLNDPKIMLKAFNQEVFLGRTKDPLALEVRGENDKMFGILLTDGPQWAHQASFTFKTLKVQH